MLGQRPKTRGIPEKDPYVYVVCWAPELGTCMSHMFLSLQTILNQA